MLKKLQNHRKLKNNDYLTISFLEPSYLHPGSDEVTVADVARFIESKYGLIDGFTAYIEKPLISRLTKHILNNGKNQIHRVEQWLQAEWRNYIVKKLHNIRTRASEKEGREAFIQTGSYYRSLQVVINFN